MSAAGGATLLSLVYFVLFTQAQLTTKFSSWLLLGIRFDNLLESFAVTTFLMGLFYLGSFQKLSIEFFTTVYLLLLHLIGPLVAYLQYLTYLFHDINNGENKKDVQRSRCSLKWFLYIVFIETPYNSFVRYNYRIGIFLSCLLKITCSFFVDCSTFGGSGGSAATILTIRTVIFAPITEELVFRSVMVPVLYAALVPTSATAPWAVVRLNPICFGVAHAHHLLDKLRSGTPLGPALLGTAVQFTYTSIFGAIATLLFLRTGSVFSAIISHCICNIVGLPDISFLTEPPKNAQKYDLSNFSFDDYSRLHPYRYLHLLVHGSGLVLFCACILPCTAHLASGSLYWSMAH
jgi:membrane protease YdiL (CAAX protease family)